MAMTMEQLMALTQDQLPDAAFALTSADIPMLVNLLAEKNDQIRYQAFQLLQYRSAQFADVYPFWDTLRAKLQSENSYQRSLGIMLLAENARWDTENKMQAAIRECLLILHDEKPITVRQGIQSLGKIAEAQPALRGAIADALTAIDLSQIKETMRKSVLLDSLRVLAAIRKGYASEAVDRYIFRALADGILDKKSEKEIRGML